MTNDSQGSQDSDNKFLRTVLVGVICILFIAWLIYFGYTKKEQAPVKAKECEQKCIQQGYPGYDFKWNVFSESKCICFGERTK